MNKTQKALVEQLAPVAEPHEQINPETRTKDGLKYSPNYVAGYNDGLKAAQQQEPVAYMNQNGVIHPADYEWEGVGNILTPLYTSPPYEATPLASKPKNVMRVKRISDQSVELVFTSCAAASEFIVAHGIKGEQK